MHCMHMIFKASHAKIAETEYPILAVFVFDLAEHGTKWPDSFCARKQGPLRATEFLLFEGFGARP